MPSFLIRQTTVREVKDLCAQYHGYGGAGNSMTYAFGVYEEHVLVAAYAWQPPPPGSARNVCPEAPQGVLALSRMVAVPRDKRRLKHISKPLMHQMKKMIDRTRWPVLVTYSDEGQGHNGYVYQCSGWERTCVNERAVYEDENGTRMSSYSNGTHDTGGLTRRGNTKIQRWEHWACHRGFASWWMYLNGWRRVPIQGKTWRSGNQAHTWMRHTQ